jgi:hypothetical protein
MTGNGEQFLREDEAVLAGGGIEESTRHHRGENHAVTVVQEHLRRAASRVGGVARTAHSDCICGGTRPSFGSKWL